MNEIRRKFKIMKILTVKFRGHSVQLNIKVKLKNLWFVLMGKSIDSQM